MSIGGANGDDPAAVYFKRNVKKVQDKVAALRNALDLFLMGVSHTGEDNGQSQTDNDKSNNQSPA